MGDLPNMAGIAKILDETQARERRILDKIEEKGEALSEAYEMLWADHRLTDVEGYEGVKAWHGLAVALANATQQYAAEVGRLLALVSEAVALEAE